MPNVGYAPNGDSEESKEDKDGLEATCGTSKQAAAGRKGLNPEDAAGALGTRRRDADASIAGTGSRSMVDANPSENIKSSFVRRGLILVTRIGLLPSSELDSSEVGGVVSTGGY